MMPNFIDYTGKKIGRMTFIRYEMNGAKRRWIAECECGKTQSYRVDYFATIRKKGKMFECYDCKMKRKSPIILDKKYGRLTIIGRDYSVKQKGVWYLCLCDCGQKTTVISQHLSHRKHPTRSCGCLMRKLHSKNVNTTQYPPAHGLRTIKSTIENKEKKRLYTMRTSLAAACYNPKCSRYEWIGGKGFTLCDLWRNGVKDFYQWAIDNGYELGMAIYIKDGEKEYSPDTCYLQYRGDRNKVKS